MNKPNIHTPLFIGGPWDGKRIRVIARLNGVCVPIHHAPEAESLVPIHHAPEADNYSVHRYAREPLRTPEREFQLFISEELTIGQAVALLIDRYPEEK